MSISKQTLDFLFENYVTNSREWFQQHKGQYKALVESPLVALAEELLPTLQSIDPLITTEPKRSLSRIWKDMRVNRSGMFFRDGMWLSFTREKGKGTPEFYFDLDQTGYRYGIGFYWMSAELLGTVRDWVLRGDRRYVQAQKALDARPHFAVEGDEYKRKKFPDAPSALQPWLNRKSLSVMHEGSDTELLFSPRLGAVLCEDFRKLAPVYHFFLEAYLAANA